MGIHEDLKKTEQQLLEKLALEYRMVEARTGGIVKEENEKALAAEAVSVAMLENCEELVAEAGGYATKAIDILLGDEANLGAADWDSIAWLGLDGHYDSAETPSMFRVGSLELGLGSKSVVLPAMLPNPAFENLVLRTTLARGVSIIESLLVRVLATTPGVKITIIDPSNNGSSLARFGKADTNRGGVFKPTVIREEDISNTLEELNQRVSSVAQNYLQGSAANIHEYNKKAAVSEELNLVIVIRPESYSNTQLMQLSKLLRTGEKHGVTMIELLVGHTGEGSGASATAKELYTNVVPHVDEDYFNVSLTSAAQTALNAKSAPLRWRASEAPPASLINEVIAHAQKARASALKPLGLADLLHPKWATPGSILQAPVGMSGTNPFNMELGVSGAHPHLLVAGRTGAGKSTFLHSLILSLASTYSPEDLNFYLVDAKQGVEMSNYVPGAKSLSGATYLPHVKIAAIKSDIRTYMSVLEKVRKEISLRGKICSRNGVTSVVELAEQYPEKKLPRIVVVLDEFHVLLTDPQFGQEASFLLKDVAKQARAYGIHLVLATQSLGNMGARGENAALFEQLGNRVALSCDANVSEMVLGLGNTAASRLTRLGEAIFTSVVGEPEHNVPFQVGYVSPGAERPEMITELYERAVNAGELEEPFVFSGDTLSSIAESPICLSGSRAVGGETEVWLGDPVSIRGPVSTRIDSFKGGNLLLLGVGSDDALDLGGTLVAAGLSALAAHRDARFILVGAHRDDPRESIISEFHDFLKAQGANSTLLAPGRRAEASLAELDAEIKAKVQEGAEPEEGIQTFVIVADGDGTLSNGVLQGIASVGASVGVHLIAAYSTKRSLAAGMGMTVADKALSFFDSRVFMLLNSSESSASSLGLPERPANEEERFTLWESSRPNKVEVFVPFKAPQGQEWDALKTVANFKKES